MKGCLRLQDNKLVSIMMESTFYDVSFHSSSCGKLELELRRLLLPNSPFRNPAIDMSEDTLRHKSGEIAQPYGERRVLYSAKAEGEPKETP